MGYACDSDMPGGSVIEATANCPAPPPPPPPPEPAPERGFWPGLGPN